MFNKINNKKAISLYAIRNPNNPNLFLTVCGSKNQALEYLTRYLQMDHFEHFKAWCSLRNLDVTDLRSFAVYMRDCIDVEEFEKYKIVKIKYEMGTILSMVRICCGCLPLGCSFETQMEDMIMQNIVSLNSAQNDSKEGDDNADNQG